MKKIMDKKKIVFFTGAGISRESGIDTFRDNGGIWEKTPIEMVATATAMYENTDVVLEFFNERRKDLEEIEPNLAHELVAKLEEDFEVVVITQNVDDLHERAGSSDIIHLHGELTKVRSMVDDNLITDIGYGNIEMGDLASDGEQLRPHVVLFGENVPKLELATKECFDADYLVIIGSTLSVYPAASIIEYVGDDTQIFNINPDSDFDYDGLYESFPFLRKRLNNIHENATVGMDLLYKKIMNE